MQVIAGQRWLGRERLVGYVQAMAFSLVYLGEHFVVDELAGWGAAAAVYFGGSRVLDWRQRKQRWREQQQWPRAATPSEAATPPAVRLAEHRHPLNTLSTGIR